VAGEPAGEVPNVSGEFANDFADSLAAESSHAADEQTGLLSTETAANEAGAGGLPWENVAQNNPPDQASTEQPNTVPLDSEPIPSRDEAAPAASADEPPLADEKRPQADSNPLDRVVPPAESKPDSTDPAASGALIDIETPGVPLADAQTVAPGESTQSPASDASSAILRSTRLDAWQLGSRLSLAALANDRGVAAENVASWMAYCKTLAAALGTAVGDLPQRGLAGRNQAASRQVLEYFLTEGRQIGGDLGKRHGPDHAALLEVAIKSNLLRVLYAPESPSAEAISAAIAQAAPRAQLPADLWQPLLDLLAAQADAAEVRTAVRSFHAAVERHLAEDAKP
jgi:hypothetical protein